MDGTVRSPLHTAEVLWMALSGSPRSGTDRRPVASTTMVVLGAIIGAAGVGYLLAGGRRSQSSAGRAALAPRLRDRRQASGDKGGPGLRLGPAREWTRVQGRPAAPARAGPAYPTR